MILFVKHILYLYWGIYSFKDLVYKTVVIVRIKLMDINLSLSLKFIMSSVSLVFKCNYFSSDQHNKWYFDIKTSSCPFSCIEVATDSEPTLLISQGGLLETTRSHWIIKPCQDLSVSHFEEGYFSSNVKCCSIIYINVNELLSWSLWTVGSLLKYWSRAKHEENLYFHIRCTNDIVNRTKMMNWQGRVT